MSDLTYLSFAKAALERATKSFCASLGSLLVADGTGIVNTAWADRLSVAGMAALLSILFSVGSAPFGGTGPSLANEAIVPPAVDPATDAGHVDVITTVIVAAITAVAVVGLLAAI